MSLPRYVPEMSLYRDQEMVTPPFLKSVLSDEALQQAISKDAKKSSLEAIVLRPEERVEDAGMPGMQSIYSKYRPSSLILNSHNVWKSTEAVRDWTYIPTNKEKAWRLIQTNKYQIELDDLKELENPSVEEKQQMLVLTDLIHQLGEKGEGYLTTAFDMFGTKERGILWTLGAANIPVVVTTTFTSQKNRGQSFRIKRAEAPDGQNTHEFTIEIGNGNSLYDLVIGDDGNSSEFRHYRNMSEKARFDLIKSLNKILDKGRLTAKDHSDIDAKTLRIKKIKAAKKKEHRTELTPEEDREIDRLEREIQEIKDGKKGLSDEDEKNRQELEDQIYLAREKFNLQESTKDLLGRAIDITFKFLRSGFVIIQSKDGRKIYENKRLTGGVPEGAEPVYGDGLPDKAFITIKSDGGMWSLLYGNPQYRFHGSVTTQAFTLPFILTDQDIQWVVEYDSSSPGCEMEYKLEEVKKKNGESYTDPLYIIKIDMYSNRIFDKKLQGRYTPELYYLELHISPKQSQEPPTEIWSSLSPENRNCDDSSRVIDLDLNEDRDRSRQCTLTIGLGHNYHELPVLIDGSACDIKIIDRKTNSTYTMLRHGKAIVNKRDGLKDVSNNSGEILIVNAAGSSVDMETIGCEGFLYKEVLVPLTGNNMYVGDYIRIMAFDAGLPYHLLSSLPVGDEGGCPRIKKIKPGCAPDVKPAFGASLWQWLQYVVKEHANNWQLWSDENGLRLTSLDQRDRTDVHFSKNADACSDRALRRYSSQPGGLELEQDIRDYYTQATFIGAVNPNTGMRYVGTANIPQATDSRFKESMFYIGVDNQYTSSVDDSLKSNADCRKSARRYLNITKLTPKGLPPWKLEFRVDWDPTLRAGDLILVNGIKYLLDGTTFSPLNSGDKMGQKMNLQGRLAEDKRVPNGD